MRRRAAVVLAALTVVGCASTPARPSTPSAAPVTPTPAASSPSAPATATPATPAPTASAATTCAAVAAALPMREQAAQLVMMGVHGDLDSAERAALEKYGFGSVILMGNTTDGVAGTKRRTEAIQAAGGGEVIVAVDQEGGQVRRLRGAGYDEMPSAAEQAKLGPEALATAARGWGEQMARAGVHLDLAPVGDVVPAAKLRSNEPIGRLGRGYGTTPDEVARNVEAVVTGFQAAGIASSVKHFPNLGEVVGNTDFAAKVVDDVTTADTPALEPYRRAIAVDVETIMVATAYYARIDAAAPAAFSPAVISILRDDLGFTGVIVSDDLGVAKAVAGVPAKERGVRFVRAGGDLAIAVDPKPATAMVDGLVAAAEADPALASRVAESAGRVLALKAGLGLATCG